MKKITTKLLKVLLVIVLAFTSLFNSISVQAMETVKNLMDSEGVEKVYSKEFISKEDAAYAFCRTLDKQNVLNKKIINIGGGATCRSTYRELLINILKYHGISFNYLLTMIFIAKNYTSPVLLDSDKANEILNFRNDSVQSYLMRQKRRSHKRKVAIVFGKPFIWLLQRKVK